MTVIAVAYKSRRYLDTFLTAQHRFRDPRVKRILVVDNASRDGTRDWLKGHAPVVDSIRLPINIQHGPALDLAVLMTRTEYFVTLDIDAFPITPDWLDCVLDPLAHGADVAGAAFGPDGPTSPANSAYAHPCFLAMRTKTFLDRKLSFAPVRARRALVYDTGQLISVRSGGHVALVPPTHIEGPGFLATTYGGAVFHLFFGTRASQSTDPVMVRKANEAAIAWYEARARYLGT